MIASLQVFADGAEEHMGAWGGASMWVWGLAMMLLLVLLVVGLVRAGADGRRSESQQPNDEASSAREILSERYAKGDISTREYRERIGQL